jgi:class 3 adenylate cyclase
MQKSKIKQKSVFVGAGLVIGCLFVAYMYMQTKNLAREYYADYTLVRERNILIYSQLAQRMFANGMYEQIPPALKDAVDSFLVDWFILSYQGVIIAAFPEGFQKVDPGKLKNEELENPHFSYKTIQLKADTALTIGITKGADYYAQRQLERYWKALVQDIVVPAGLALLVFFFFLRDILRSVGLLRARGQERWAELEKIKSQSAEGQVLLESLKEMRAQETKKDQQLQKIAKEMLPSLRSELESGREPPYEFHCTLVRLDVNHYTELFMSPERNSFLLFLNKYFTEVAQIVSRYQGLIYEFIGDEILFYVKETPEQNSLSAAVGAVRDIFALTSELETEFRQQFSRPLTIKSSLARGVLRFGPLVETHTLSGTILIETVRMLSHVEDKTQSVLVLSEQESHDCASLIRVQRQKTTQLKGFAEASRLVFVSEFQPISRSLPEAQLAYFRSDEGLLRSCEILISQAQSSFSPVLMAWRSLYLAAASVPVSEAFLQMGKFLAQEPAKEVALSQWLFLLPRFVPGGVKFAQCEEILHACWQAQDTRVVADALEAAFFLSIEPPDLESYLSHPAPRVVARALALLGRRDLGEVFLGSLRKAILAAEAHPQYQSSLEFVLQQLENFWLHKDPVYYRNQWDFHSLSQQVHQRKKQPDGDKTKSAA